MAKMDNGFMFSGENTMDVNYQDYIKSSKWKEKSEAAKKRAGYRCQVCNDENFLNVHHRTYENLGNENDNDLTVLCASCHEKFHDVINKDVVTARAYVPRPGDKILIRNGKNKWGKVVILTILLKKKDTYKGEEGFLFDKLDTYGVCDGTSWIGLKSFDKAFLQILSRDPE
jgi:hypothetical protein